MEEGQLSIKDINGVVGHRASILEIYLKMGVE